MLKRADEVEARVVLMDQAAPQVRADRAEAMVRRAEKFAEQLAGLEEPTVQAATAEEATVRVELPAIQFRMQVMGRM